jgi:methionyl-tRNA synthetase
MTHKNCDGKVPQPGPFDAADEVMLARADAVLAEVADNIERVHLKAALGAAMAVAQETNAYLNETEPWKTAKADPQRTGTSLYVALCAINALKIALYPFLPFASQQVHEFLGMSGAIDGAGWIATRPQPGTPLGAVAPLFKKIDVADVEGEARLTA